MDEFQEKVLSYVQNHEISDPVDYLVSAVRPYAIQDLNLEMSRCRRCCLSTSLVRGVSSGNERAKILVVSEFPTDEQEDIVRKGVAAPFAYTPDSDYLKELYFNKYNLKPEVFFWINLVNCCPRDDLGHLKTPEKEEMDRCHVFLRKASEIVRPRYVIMMGAIVLDHYNQELNIHLDRGSWINVNGYPAIVSYSPRELRLMREENNKITIRRGMEKDIRAVLERYKNEYPEEYPSLFKGENQ